MKIDLSDKVVFPSMGNAWGEEEGRFIHAITHSSGLVDVKIIFNDILIPKPKWSGFYEHTDGLKVVTWFTGTIEEFLLANGKVLDGATLNVKYTKADIIPQFVPTNNNAPWQYTVPKPKVNEIYSVGIDVGIFDNESPGSVGWANYNSPKCECGAESVGVKDYNAGHSSWCPVHHSKAILF